MGNAWLDVDAAVTVPVNVAALIDDTDFKTREESITFDQAGMDLVWNFLTTAGVITHTEVIPTDTGGDYDWTNVGNGMYKIVIPASGGASINNDAEGFGWFTGFATGILPWVGPMIGFRDANLNALLVDSAFSTTRGLSGTALPDAVADASGGLVTGDGNVVFTAGVGNRPAVDIEALGGTVQSADDLKDFADAGYDPGTNKVQGVVLVDTTTTNSDLVSAANVVDEWESQSQADPTGFHVNVQEWVDTVVTISSTSAKPEVDLFSVSDNVTSANNLQSQYDTTGLTGDTFPSTQAQLGNISTGSAAINTTANSDTTVTTGSETLTFAATHELDDSYHEIAPVGSIEMYYEFNIGANAAPVSALWQGYVTTNNDNVEVYAFNWGTTWEQIGTIAGTVSTARVEQIFNYTAAHVGTGVNAGLVRLRFASSGGDVATNLATDRLLTSYTIVNQSVGYANGQIWVDTNASNINTVDFVDGVADNPVSTWAAALTLNGSLGLNRFHIANGSTITLTGNSDNYTLTGDAWALELGSQSIINVHIQGADVSGLSTGSGSDFHDCELGTCTIGPGSFIRCRTSSNTSGGFTCQTAGTYIFDRCSSGIAGNNTPTVTLPGSGSSFINYRDYSGRSNKR